MKIMPNSEEKKLKQYKEYVKKRLATITPLLQKAAVGDFSEKIEIPQKEDEFTELLVGLSLMVEDLKGLEEERKNTEVETRKRLLELEKWKRLTTGRELKMIELKKELERLKKEFQEKS